MKVAQSKRDWPVRHGQSAALGNAAPLSFSPSPREERAGRGQGVRGSLPDRLESHQTRFEPRPGGVSTGGAAGRADCCLQRHGGRLELDDDSPPEAIRQAGDPRDYSKIEETMSPEVLEIVGDWAVQHVLFSTLRISPSQDCRFVESSVDGTAITMRRSCHRKNQWCESNYQ